MICFFPKIFLQFILSFVKKKKKKGRREEEERGVGNKSVLHEFPTHKELSQGREGEGEGDSLGSARLGVWFFEAFRNRFELGLQLWHLKKKN